MTTPAIFEVTPLAQKILEIISGTKYEEMIFSPEKWTELCDKAIDHSKEAETYLREGVAIIQTDPDFSQMDEYEQESAKIQRHIMQPMKLQIEGIISGVLNAQKSFIEIKQIISKK